MSRATTKNANGLPLPQVVSTRYGRALSVTTPEGVALRFPIASPGARLLGFLIDSLLINVLPLVALLIAGRLGAPLDDRALQTVFVLGLFVLRFGYFPLFETRWNGQTPGKRVVGTRVIDVYGGPLRAGSVFIRNITREAEITLPLVVMFFPHLLFERGTDATRALSALWALVFLLLPVLNRWGLRLGDVIGGTVVVETPRPQLLDDVLKGHGDEELRYTFNGEQLSLYGAYELEVLEQVLRHVDGGDSTVARVVAEQIANKIGWGDNDTVTHDAARFLREFYLAQRAFLEQRLQYGYRQNRKRVGRISGVRS